MKRMTQLFVMIALFTTGCNKSDEPSGSAYTNSPRTAVPDELAGVNWHLGDVSTFFSGDFWADQRSFVIGNTANGQRYRFTKDGYCEMYNYYATNPGCGLSQRYAWFKGTVEFRNDRFTFYPVEGRKKLADDCNAAANYDRIANPGEREDLKKTYRWVLSTGPAGDKIFTIFDIGGAYPDAPIEYTVKP